MRSEDSEHKRSESSRGEGGVHGNHMETFRPPTCHHPNGKSRPPRVATIFRPRERGIPVLFRPVMRLEGMRGDDVSELPACFEFARADKFEVKEAAILACFNCLRDFVPPGLRGPVFTECGFCKSFPSTADEWPRLRTWGCPDGGIDFAPKPSAT